MRYKIFIFDVDGVFTDGGLYYLGSREIGRKFNVRDGLGIRILQQTPIVPVIVTGKKNRGSCYTHGSIEDSSCVSWYSG